MPLEAAPLAPTEALEFWKAKAQLTPAEFAELTQQAKARAFAVSGLARREQIAAVHGALQEALEKGETLAAFKKRLAPLFEQKGWTGRAAWRVENIYRTNLQSAYQAGRHAQMKATADSRPFWRYLAIKDRRTRPTHLALHGLVFRHDHEFWATWYPPNGFQCRCTVRALSQSQMDRRGLEAQTRTPRLVEPFDPASGNRLPARPLVPEPGWAGNVGQDWLHGLAPAQAATPIISLATRALCRDGRGLFADDPCKPPLASLERRHVLTVDEAEIMPAGLADEDYVRAFLREFGLEDIDGSIVHELPGGVPVVISKDLFVDKLSRTLKVGKGGRAPYVRLLARTIISPYEIWWQTIRAIDAKGAPTGRIREKISLLRLFAGVDGKIGGFAVFDLIDGRQWRGTTIFTPGANKKTQATRDDYILRYLEDQRAGVLLYREP